MPPKPKETVKKATPNIIRPPISNASLVIVPNDAVEGHQERLERCVEWTIAGSAIRYHKEKCIKEDIPPVSFTQALQKKITNSLLNGFLNEESTMSLQDHWEITLPLAIWDNENCGTEEKKICFKSENNITDDIIELIKNTVRNDDREILKNGLKEASVLRVTNSEMTYLDEGLKDFKNLSSLILCGNYIDQIDCDMLTPGLRVLELQANRISNFDSFNTLPNHLLYLGLSRNILTEDGIQGISQLPHMLTVLDLSDNDICYLEPLLEMLARLPNLSSLLLIGNPCSMCAAYALTTVSRLHRLRWLDNRQVLRTDRPIDIYEPHPDDLRAAYFNFTIFRIMSAPCPPKLEKGQTGLFHVELELPLLDAHRRSFLMFGRYESLVVILPSPEDDFVSHTTIGSKNSKETAPMEAEGQSEETDIFMRLEPKNSMIIENFTKFESNKVPWNKVMNFQEPTLRIFCPDLKALRDTFKSTITLKLIYTLTIPLKKPDKKTDIAFKFKQPPTELRGTIATIKCSLRSPDWSQNSQHFHWDDSLGTTDAIHWGDGDLTAVQYQQTTVKTQKGKQDLDPKAEKQQIPENFTCHFGFGIDTLHT